MKATLSHITVYGVDLARRADGTPPEHFHFILPQGARDMFVGWRDHFRWAIARAKGKDVPKPVRWDNSSLDSAIRAEAWLRGYELIGRDIQPLPNVVKPDKAPTRFLDPRLLALALGCSDDPPRGEKAAVRFMFDALHSMRGAARPRQHVARSLGAFQSLSGDNSTLVSAASSFARGFEKHANGGNPTMWEPMPWSVPWEAAIRHGAKILSNERVDEELGVPHMACVAANLLMLLNCMQWQDMDDLTGERYGYRP